MSVDLFGLGSAISGLIQTGMNYDINKKNYELAKENYEWQKGQTEWQNNFAKEQFEYQKNLNNLTMQRQDEEIQRRMQDMQKAGLNPLGTGITGGASSGGTAGTSLSGGSGNVTAPQMEGIAGLENIMSGVMNILTQKQNISQSKTQENLIKEQTKTEREKQESVNAETKEIQRKTQYYDDLSSKTEAEIQAIMKENELRELRKETEQAKAFDTWQSGYNKEHDRNWGKSTGTKTNEKSYYGVLDGSGVIQGGGILGNSLEQLFRNIWNAITK